MTTESLSRRVYTQSDSPGAARINAASERFDLAVRRPIHLLC